ncbi:MAG TPA: RNA polymerase sigma factor [Terriglobales bacterium]|nr:RNA polymerase sigma factor [Terriglobales bacterium]
MAMYLPEQVILSRTIAAQSADEQVEAVVRLHARFVYQVAYAVLRHPQEAEDAAQETFIRVWKHAKELSGVLNQRAWLARIAWRVAVDRRRKHSAITGEEDLPELPAGGAGAEESIIRSQQMALLESMIATLPRELRETLTLSAVEEMTSVEIAEVLEIPESSVRGRLLRARQLLREKLQVLMERKQKDGKRDFKAGADV